jgi:hypothetical protein
MRIEEGNFYFPEMEEFYSVALLDDDNTPLLFANNIDCMEIVKRAIEDSEEWK